MSAERAQHSAPCMRAWAEGSSIVCPSGQGAGTSGQGAATYIRLQSTVSASPGSAAWPARQYECLPHDSIRRHPFAWLSPGGGHIVREALA